ncbi:hypothetical protein [Flavobacterium cheniae]|uniref:Capsular polysaccharide biosynthesis protein n=1 Tax=Flavobacterium cheniae TaxID=295428 RepID=A0A562KPH8_9FLAO|nr:hypothetical protein [Flavobacterium cheniae]TDR22955.1 hypothetical protein C8D80_1911 [Flavobacterium cheniae]TWH97185.1 hypothetical protein IP97_00612 [Flavobacterium cheniae]
MNSISSQDEIKKVILHIEEKWPVEKWEVNHIKIWPYLRIKLYIHLLMMMNKKLEKDETTSDVKHTSSSKKTIFSKLFLIFSSFFKLNFFFFSLKKKPHLLFGSHIHRVKQNGLYFNRFYDSLVDIHHLKNEVYNVEYQKVYPNTFNKEAVISLEQEVRNYKNLLNFKEKFTSKNDSVSLENYDDFYAYLKQLPIRLDLLRFSVQDLKNWSRRVIALQPFFRRFYKKTQPKTLVFLGFYGYDDLYAALLTANQMGIKTVDFQHGPQTNIHMVFSAWTKFPSDGYALLPKEFWNWDEFSKINIEKWCHKNNSIAKVVGQPFVNYWLKHNHFERSESNTIIYSLQTFPFEIQDMLTPKVIQLIKDLPYQWILRLHPRNYIEIEEIKAFLIQHQIEDKAIIQSSIDEMPLPKALLSSIVHITNFSGCLIEAHLLGVPTILINNIGKEMFSQYIDDEKVFYLNQEDDDFCFNFSTLTKYIKPSNSKLISEHGNPFK